MPETTHSHLLLGDSARAKILRGATALADAVRPTLGPRSRSILLRRPYGSPMVCDDGVTIAKELHLSDPEEDLGAQILREAAVRTGDAVGDGTTTATLLAHAVLHEGLRNVVAGTSAIDLKRGLDRGVEIVVSALRRLSRPVSGREEKIRIATVSAHDDRKIGELVADALERVGGDGIVTVEEAKATETTLEVTVGMQLDHGYLSPYFVTDTEKMQTVLEEALVLIHDRRISAAKDILPVLELVANQGRPLLIIADDVEADALATLVVNRLRGIVHVVAVKAPGFGDRRKEMLQDIAIVTGGSVSSEELGVELAHIGLEALGRCKRAIVTRETTTIVGGGGDGERIAAREKELRRQIEESRSDYDRDKLKERLAKLVGGVAVIRAGAPSEAEMLRRREAFEDAINAAKAAVAEGVVAGGGWSLLQAMDELAKAEQNASENERVGLRVLRQALETPARQIAANSGADPGVVVERIRREHLGFDARNGSFVDLFAAGIIDPTKVVRLALENAVSVAGTLLLAEGTLTQVEEKKETPEALPPIA